MPPIPDRSHDWRFVHDDFEGPEDGRCGTAACVAECQDLVDEQTELAELAEATQMIKTVAIMRGISGSGKTTLAERLRDRAMEKGLTAEIVSNDHFWLRPVEGCGTQYIFEPARMGEAAVSCMTAFLKAIRDNVDLIIVDNTHIRRWEYENYELAADMFGYEAVVYGLRVETVAELREFAARNRHGVPPEVVARMAMNYEERPWVC